MTRQAEQELARGWAESRCSGQQDRLKLALDAADMPCWEINLLNGQHDWSPRAGILLGFAPGSFDGRRDTFLSRVHPDDAGLIEEAERTAMRTGSLRQEFRILQPNQETRWLYRSGKVFCNEDKIPTHLVGVMMDITDRKQLETALREKLDELEQLNDNVPAVVYRYVLKADGQEYFSRLSENARDIFGLPRDACMDDMAAVWGKVHPEDIPGIKASIAESARTLRPWHHQFRLQTSTDRHRWLEGKSSPKRLDTGDLVWDGVIVDISERKHSEIALRESVHRQGQILDSVQDMVFCKAIDSSLVYVNQATCRHYNMTVDQLLGIKDASYNDSQTTEQYLEDDREVFQHGRSVERLEEPNRRADGVIRYFHTIKTPILDTEGRVVELVGVARDITERKQIQESLRVHARQQAAVAELGQMALAQTDLAAVMERAVTLVAESLGVDYVKVLELLPDGRGFLLRAGVGWSQGLVGEAMVELDSHTPSGYSLSAGETVTVENLTTDPRFRGSSLLRDHQIVSGMTVVIHGSDHPFGVLGAYTSRQRGFSQDDVNFLQAIAHILATAIRRRSAEQALEESEAEFRALFTAMTDVVTVRDKRGRCLKVAPTNAVLPRPAEELLGKTIQESFPAIQAGLLQEGIETALARGKTIQVDFSLDVEGRTIWYATSISPMSEDSVVMVARDISDRKQVEERLSLSLKSLDSHFDTSLLAIIEWDQHRHVRRWSKQAEQIFGWSESEVQNMDIPSWQFVHEDDAGWVSEQMTALRRGWVNRCRFENRNYRKDGSILNCEWHSSAIFDAAGNLESVLSFAQDITSRRQTQEELRQQKELLQTIVDHLPVMVALYSSDGEVLMVNREMEDVIGWSKEEYNTMDCLRSCYPTPEDYQQMRAHVAAADSTWKDFKTKIRDGRELDTTWAQIRLSDGRQIGIGQDITDRKSAEQQLQSLVEATAAVTGQDFFPTLVSHISKALNVSYAIVTELIDDELHALSFWANGSLQPVFHYHPAQTPCAYTLKEKVYYCPDSVQQLFPDDFDLVQMQAESYLGVALHGTDGEVIGNLCVLDQGCLDNPAQAETLLNVFASRAAAELERERATRALEQLNRNLETLVQQRTAELSQRTAQLEASNKELESFSYSVSHDLRAPLRHINGFVNALQQKLEQDQALDDPKTRHYLHVIAASSHKMGQLIDGLLTLSRLGRRSMEFRPVNLRELVDQAIVLVQEQSQTANNVSFSIGSLPSMRGDAILLQQVFSNLIDNSVKFSSHLASPRVEIGALSDDTIFVRDNGVGFQMQYAGKLFGAFQRLHSQSEFAGTGIGLAIVQRIIHRHGGKIWAESTPDHGATFYFTLASAPDDFRRSTQTSHDSDTRSCHIHF
ncbi:MAG: hypothetical protein ER33_10495 [Cyanobium sp. CACIAM 14]|nr:MAG: hypothetical protein ER33_10495 [Cyanobium sp. CACIAM 14]